MDEFKQLKVFINNKIDELKSKLKKIKQVEKEYNSEKELINIDETNILSNRRKKDILLLYPSFKKDLKEIDTISHYLFSIKNGELQDINTYEFRAIINELGLDNSQKIIDDFRLLKRNSDKNEEYYQNVENLTLELFLTYKSFINSIKFNLLKEFDEKYGSINFENEINSILTQLEELKKYDIFNDEASIVKYFDTSEEIGEFFNWIKNNVEEELQEKLIPLLLSEELLKENVEKAREQEILQNRDKLIENLQDKHIDVSNIDLSNYNELEQETINKGLEIYKELRMNIVDRNDLLVDQENLSVEEKEYFYLLNDRYNWDVVLFDIENNIIPKISENKENVLNTFKLLNKHYDRYKMERDRRNDLLDDIFEQVESYEKLIRFGEKFNSNQYFYVIREQINEDDERYPKGVSFKQIQMNYFLNNVVKKEIEKLNELRRKIENNINNNSIISETKEIELDSLRIIDGINIDSLSDEFDKIYENASQFVDSFKEELKKVYEQSGVFIPNELSGKPRNLVFCLFDIEKSRTSKYGKTFLRTKQDLSSMDSSSFREPKIKVLYLDEKDETKFDIPHMDFFRIRQLNSKRSGFVKIYPSKKVIEILRKKYNLDDDFEIFGIIDSITKVSKNEVYKALIDKIRDNNQEISRIGELFYNGDNIEELFQLIDNGIERLDNIICDDTKRL